MSLLTRRTAISLAAALALGAGMAAAQSAPLKAELVDKDAKARKKEATVKATVTGLSLVDPATVGEKAAPGQGHLHYQVDDGPVIATTAPKLSFHGLRPGAHKIVVMLAANDHKPLGPQQSFDVTIPSSTAQR